MEADPTDRRFKAQVSRLNRLIRHHEALQVQLPHAADTFQPKIDKMRILRDSYVNYLRECKCGCPRWAHADNLKCPFAATSFEDSFALQDY
jgi:hypothetical protein